MKIECSSNTYDSESENPEEHPIHYHCHKLPVVFHLKKLKLTLQDRNKIIYKSTINLRPQKSTLCPKKSISGRTKITLCRKNQSQAAKINLMSKNQSLAAKINLMSKKSISGRKNQPYVKMVH